MKASNRRKKLEARQAEFDREKAQATGTKADMYMKGSFHRPGSNKK
jgi:hypothetical protein